MVSAVLLNIYSYPMVNLGCTFDSTKFNQVFLWLVAIPEMLLRLICLGFWNSNKWLKQRSNGLTTLQYCTYTAWFIYTICSY